MSSVGRDPGGDALSAKKRALLELLLERQASAKEAKRIPRRADPSNAPLSFAQERLWVLAELDPQSTAYNIRRVLSIRGPLDVPRLADAIERIVQRHEILRTTYPEVTGRPLQAVAAKSIIPLEVKDLDLEEGQRDARARELIEEELSRPFDLAEGPLLRAVLLRNSPEDHTLVISMHHIISDGWSLGIFFRELAALYGGSAVPEVPLQYPDYAAWQRARHTREHTARNLDYWTKQLAAVTPLDLPLDRARPEHQSFRGARKSIFIPGELRAAIESQAKRAGATLFMGLLAAYEVLLFRYTGQSDIAVGTPIAGRSQRELESLIGCFVNTLVMRADLSGDPSFAEVLERVKTRALAAYAHQELPFEKLVEALAPQRDLTRSPLFQTMFVLRDTPADHPPELPGLEVRLLDIDPRTAQLDISLYLGTEGDGLSGHFEYSTELFDPATIDRFAAHFENLLRAAAAQPELPISLLALLSAEERRQLIYAWNDTRADYPRELTAAQLFEAQAAKRPEAIAAVFEEEKISYGALDRRANQLAHHLLAEGVTPGSLVGISVERSLEMLVGLLGIWKAGAAYVPLDPAFPAQRLTSMAQDAELKTIVTERHLGHLFNCSLVRVDSDSGRIALYPEHSPGVSAPGPAEDRLAYVIYTSGSTGNPKGVAVRHAALTNFLISMQKRPGLGEDDVLLAVTTISFDIAGLELYLPLISGARVVIASRDAAADGAAIRMLLERSGATVMQATPATWRALLMSGWQRSARLRVFSGGEAMTRELARELRVRAKEVHNLYGPTETTVWSSLETLGAEPSASRAIIPIGRPIANTTLHVLDGRLGPAPIGVVGELYIGGEGLAKEYLHLPELTRERFIPDPFAPETSAPENSPGRLYRTGDLARRRADGRVEFVGRADQQVKLRGFRIELGEVESVLSKHPGVVEVACVVREDVPGDQRLTAYFTVKPEAGTGTVPMPAPVELRALARTRLPEYMVPTAWMCLESLPLTPNGKVDRRALPKPRGDRPGREDSFAAPRTRTQQILATIWSEVLRRERIGVHDDFFALGGHSLLATQLVSRIREAFSAELPLRALFEAPTIAGLEKLIVPAVEKHPPLPPVELVSREEELPLSFPQQRIWFLDRFEGETGAYNIPIALSIRGALNLAALEEALRTVVRRHEVLRTTFPIVGGAPVQRIGLVPSSILRVLYFEGEQRPSPFEIKRRITDEAEAAFDLERDPPLRAQLLVLRGGAPADPADQEYVLLLTMHHVASDGWSLGLLLRELSIAYGALARNSTPDLPSLPIQYADFAAWQRRWLTRDVLASELDYWAKQLEYAPALLELPTDRPRPPTQRFEGRTRRFTLDLELSLKLKQLGQRAGATTFMTLLAAFSTLLYRISGEEDVLIGSPIANRNAIDTERLIGCFINTLVIRTKLHGDPRFLEVLAQTRQTALDAYAHRNLPFEHLIERIHPQRNLSYTPLFQVMFVLQNAPRDATVFPGCETGKIEREGTTAKFDLTLWMEETAAGLAGGLEYNVDLFDAATIDRLIGAFRTLLEGIVRAPEERISTLPLLTEAEREALTIEPNQTQAEYSRELCLHQLFEAQVDETPEALAIEFEGRRINYRDLNRRANQLAGYLRGLGVGPNTLVGICLERSIDLVIGLLGILKAGGAYVPLDPSFPRRRLEHMIQDSRMRVIVTQRIVLAQLGLPLRGVTTVRLDADAEEIAQLPSTTPGPEVRPEHAAYVIYTSGSTGRPKGVKIRHRSVVNFLASMKNEPGISRSDVLLAVTTISFDIAGLELFLPLTSGASVVLAGKDTASDGTRLLELLQRSDITLMQATPATWRMLLLAGWTGSPNLRILVGGEALPGRLAEQLLERGREVYNLYGPTETTIWSAVEKLTPASVRKRDVVPIGHPIANTQIYILDAHKNPVPFGVRGEIYIGGDGVAKGYHEQPELNEEKFLADPFHRDEKGHAGRMYRTGDLGRWIARDRIEFLGRADYQVKLRGFRIELGEVEAVLAEHAAVQQALAVVREDHPGDQRLVAYYLARGEQEPSSADLRAFVKAKLPDYMVPSLFVKLDAFPLTPNAKIDRRALPAPLEIQARAGKSFAGPRNSLELLLVSIWESVLGVQPIGIHDNFFELGGHSLLAITLLERMQAALQRDISLITIFRGPTIAEIADVLTGNGFDVQPWHALEAIQPRGSRPPLFFIGSTLYARALARTMGGEQPVYGLNIFGLHPKDGTPFALNVEGIAERYIEDIRSVQPKGPYYLAGYCSDAKIAYEIAQQLLRAGHEVGLLAFIDEIWRVEQSRMRMLIHNLREFGPKYVSYKIRQRTRYYIHKGIVTMSLIWRRVRELAALPISIQLQHQVMIKTLYQALGNYRPGPYPGRLTLFLATESRAKYSPELARLAAGGVEVLETPGYHVELFRPPQVDVLGRQLFQCITTAAAEHAEHAEPSLTSSEA